MEKNERLPGRGKIMDIKNRTVQKVGGWPRFSWSVTRVVKGEWVKGDERGEAARVAILESL